jgi:SAM-dependent methyltransferase
MKPLDSTIEKHYEASYFNDYQKRIGEFGGIANKLKFERYIKKDDVVLDFGCGGGFLLKNLDCRERIGVELNPVARDYCNQVNKVLCVESLDEVEDESIDVVISNHCLEHTTSPFQLVAALYEKLKPGGKIVIVVPHDSYTRRWFPNDINNHLYSFSPMNLGNILQGAGFKQIQSEVFLFKWVPSRFRGFICKYFGMKVFNQLSWLYGRLDKRSVQVRAVGVKE